MKQSILMLVFVLNAVTGGYHCAVIEPKYQQLPTKVFNYQGSLPPIKDDRTGEIIKDDTIETNQTTNNTSEAEKVCWDLIVERTEVTFALHNRVLNELTKDLKDLPMNDKLREGIQKLTNKMRSDMEDALSALKDESPEEYFDALFGTSEDIVQMSHLIRDPKIDEKVFLVLVKAVSRLGRNNSMLIQEFIDQCSLANKSPRPRSFFPF